MKDQSNDQRSSRAKNVALWGLQILTAAAFLMAGFAKLSGQTMMVETFDKVGVTTTGSHLEFSKANEWKSAVVKRMTEGVASLLKANGVEWVKGTGKFTDANTIVRAPGGASPASRW